MKILITGGNGNLAKIINKGISSEKYEIVNLGRDKLNLLDQNEIEKYLNENNFDILIHTAIVGGRRTKEETSDVFYTNMIMFENIIKFSNKFKMILNFDSAAIYNRNLDILNRDEYDFKLIPYDYYGFSKYLIYNRSLQYINMYNFRIFNIFHINEENDRFIKSCFNAKKNKTNITIFEDKYFDFFYEDDFINIIKYYIDNINRQSILKKTINVCYNEKYKLSEIAMMITKNANQIMIKNSISNNNYTGNAKLLLDYNINLNGLQKSLVEYERLFNTK